MLVLLMLTIPRCCRYWYVGFVVVVILLLCISYAIIVIVLTLSCGCYCGVGRAMLVSLCSLRFCRWYASDIGVDITTSLVCCCYCVGYVIAFVVYYCCYPDATRMMLLLYMCWPYTHDFVVVRLFALLLLRFCYCCNVCMYVMLCCCCCCYYTYDGIMLWWVFMCYCYDVHGIVVLCYCVITGIMYIMSLMWSRNCWYSNIVNVSFILWCCYFDSVHCVIVAVLLWRRSVLVQRCWYRVVVASLDAIVYVVIVFSLPLLCIIVLLILWCCDRG